tara:strand:- start:71 stop:394 length:324 start_codon:yes stop_codon:yes gene_type:complete
MRWFKKLVASWARQGSDYEEEDCKPSREVVAWGSNMKSSTGTRELVVDEFAEPFRFTLSRAQGGFILSTRYYNSATDRNLGSLWLITDQQDLTAEIGKIITLESLKF